MWGEDFKKGIYMAVVEDQQRISLISIKRIVFFSSHLPSPLSLIVGQSLPITAAFKCSGDKWA
jgi:hypothetical protein